MAQQFDQLNTGNTGQTFGNEEVLPTNDEAIEQQNFDAAQLLPSVKQILAVIDEEVTAISDIRSYIKELTKADYHTITAEYRGRELYIEFLGRLKTSIANKVSDVEASDE